jgi:hypothetical protein
MARGQLTALITALGLGAIAPRLAAQDTSAVGHAPDTSGYIGAAGIDTSAQPGRLGTIDTTAGAMDTLRSGAGTLGVDSTSVSDSASVSLPGKQPGQSTSRTGDSASSTSP